MIRISTTIDKVINNEINNNGIKFDKNVKFDVNIKLDEIIKVETKMKFCMNNEKNINFFGLPPPPPPPPIWWIWDLMFAVPKINSNIQNGEYR